MVTIRLPCGFVVTLVVYLSYWFFTLVLFVHACGLLVVWICAYSLPICVCCGDCLVYAFVCFLVICIEFACWLFVVFICCVLLCFYALRFAVDCGLVCCLLLV